MSDVVTYKIFLSGPSDVGSDIECVKQTIADINKLSSPMGLRFEPLYWQEGVTPGLSAEPQERINEQFQDFDALLAVFGSKLGTQTRGHSSGTVEEINIAIGNAELSPFKKNSVMIFFKVVKLDTKSSDLESAIQVQAFRKSLSPRGILYKDFKDEFELRDAVFRTFGVLIANRVKVNNNIQKDRPVEIDKLFVSSPNISVIEEFGIMEYQDLSMESIQKATEETSIISKVMNRLGAAANKYSEELEIAAKNGDRGLSKLIMSNISNEMQKSANELEESASRVIDHYRQFFIYTRALIDMREADIGLQNTVDDRSALLIDLENLLPIIEDSKNSMNGMAKSVLGLPRMTREINQAKRRLLLASERLLQMFDDIAIETRESVNYLKL